MSSHVALRGNSRPKKQDAERIGNVDPNSQIEVTLTLRGPKLPQADSKQSSLTPEEFAKQYGSRREDADKVAHILENYGLKIEETSLGSRSMRVSGTAAAMEKAFQPALAMYHSASQGEFRGRDGEIRVPVEVADIVTGVLGFDQRQVARRKAVAIAPAAPAVAPLTPMDLEHRYNFPPGEGEAQQVAIAEFQGGYFADDLRAFCTKFGRARPSVTTVPVGLPVRTLSEILKLPPDQRKGELDASIEVMMDVEIIAGLCPKSEIFVYFAPFTQKGWVDLLNKVISGDPAKPVVLSISWGLAEDAPDWTEAARNAINDRLQAAALLGITVCVASGDDGSGDQLTDGKAHIDFPSSSPFVLSVGGTMLNGGDQSKEEVWFEPPGQRTNFGGGAGGGGVSVLFARPSWQTVTVKSLNTGAIDGRIIPDIAALAGAPLYDLIFRGHDAPNGGTSASAPLWAALILRINQNLPGNKRQQFLTPLLYQNGPNGRPRGEIGCNDITMGQNASSPEPGVGYKATKGFDAVSGWGTPNGTALLSVL